MAPGHQLLCETMFFDHYLFKELLEMKKKHFVIFRIFNLMEIDVVKSDLYEWSEE